MIENLEQVEGILCCVYFCTCCFQEDCFKAIKSQLKTSEAVDLNQILSTENKPLDNENTLSSPGLWEYRRPLTLPAVQNLLHSSIKV